MLYFYGWLSKKRAEIANPSIYSSNCANFVKILFLTGLFARGNSHVIRLSVPMQILLDVFADKNVEQQEVEESNGTTSNNEMVGDESDDGSESQLNRQISSNALLASHSLVDVCLQHVCKYIIIEMSLSLICAFKVFNLFSIIYNP